MRVLLVSYEFTYAPFSGNGMLARSIARSLLSAGCSLAVLCSRPAPDVPSLSPDNPLVPPEIPPSASLLVLPVQLATADGWRRLDDQSAFTSFWDAAEGFAASIGEWMPEVVLAVDWTGAGAWRRLRKALCLDSPPKLCYLNFRVYASGASPETAGWFNDVESAALRDADLVLSLSPADQRSLTALQQGGAAASPIHVLIPPLRGDIEALALAPPRPSSGREGTGVALPSALSRALASPHAPPSLPPSLPPSPPGPPSLRRFVTCAVRQSSEKEPIVFARFVERAAGRLRRLGLTPLLFGASAEPAYSLEVRRRLLAAFPEAVVIEDFMQPQALAASFSATALNFHPCRYDAYGMSIVEAAAFGAPSVMNGGASIGASQLLPAKAGGSFEISMVNEEQMAQDVMDILEDAARLTSVGTKARELALQWSEDAYGETLLSHLHQLIEGDSTSRQS